MTTEPISTPRDLGFGQAVADQTRERLLNKDGSFNVQRRGLPWLASMNAFNSLITMTWPRFLALLTSFYLLVNAGFAVAYLAAGPGALTGAGAAGLTGRFEQAFFFSVETFSTIGYGHTTPANFASHVLMTLEAIVGLLTTALATGLVFARFSRPVARIRFSRNAVVGPYRGGKALKFRIANLRESQIIELSARVHFSGVEESGGGRHRRFHDLALERQRVTFFPLHWTLVHPINEASPLAGLSSEDCLACDAEILIQLSGTDETFSQPVHARSSYKAEEILWDADFVSLLPPPGRRGPVSIDLQKLDDVVAAGAGSDAGPGAVT